MPVRLILWSICLLDWSAGGLTAQELPARSMHWMCGEAEAIVLGERVGPSRVRVTDWLLEPRDSRTIPDHIEIAGLEEHHRIISATATSEKAGGRILRTRRLVCFLERRGAGWYSLLPGPGGSLGLVWIEDDKCFRYHQVVEPGPFQLRPASAAPSEETLLAEIAQGLADRQEWEATLRVANLEEKAVMLASYLLERTSPEGNRGTYRERVRQFLPDLERVAVRELLVVLRDAQPGDRLDDAVLILNDLGPDASAAVPLLVGLLAKPEWADPTAVLEALGRIGDATVAHDIMPFLQAFLLPVRAEAAKALALFRYQDAAEQIAGAFPDEIEERDAYYVYVLLAALHDLDAPRAARLARKYAGHPAMESMRNLLSPILRD